MKNTLDGGPSVSDSNWWVVSISQQVVNKTRLRARTVVLIVESKEESASIGTCARRLPDIFGQRVDIQDFSENTRMLTHRSSLMNANIVTSVSTSSEASPSTLALVNVDALNRDWSRGQNVIPLP